MGEGGELYGLVEWLGGVGDYLVQVEVPLICALAGWRMNGGRRGGVLA